MAEEVLASEEQVTIRSLRCLVSTPRGQVPENGWPILIFLHGNGEAAPQELREAMTRHGPLCRSSGSAATDQFIVIVPQLPTNLKGNNWHSQADQIAAIADYAVDRYGGNRSKIYLTGFSYGGNGVLRIGVRHPEVWAALWPVDPTMAPEQGTGRPIWVSAGERARPNVESFRQAWGVQDRVENAPADAQPDRVYHDKNLNHVPTATEAYGDVVIYDWLLRHSLP